MRRLRGRDYLDVQDFDREELVHILETSRQLKLEAKRGLFQPLLENKSVGLLFDQPSTRTRISFELGVQQIDPQRAEHKRWSADERKEVLEQAAAAEVLTETTSTGVPATTREP